MASEWKPTSEAEHLALLGRHVAALHAEAKRLNRRLRNARSSIQSIEDELEALTKLIVARIAQHGSE